MTLKVLLVYVSVGISLPLLPSCKGVSPEPPVRKRLVILIRIGLKRIREHRNYPKVSKSTLFFYKHSCEIFSSQRGS